MGNNLAPTLATIYMNDLDTQIVNTFNGSVFLRRFIDDIFLTWTSNAVDGEKLLTMANKLIDSIEFTIELPTYNKLPYLDVLVSLNSETNKFATMLYVKPIHSQCITPWDSHGSIASKKSILIREMRRAISRSTDPTAKTKSLRIVTLMFTRNGYPKQFVTSVIK